MFHSLTLGLLLGWGAAIPIGAINLEIIRRNLYFGTPIGLSLGCGACMADFTYLLLLFYGILQWFHSPILLKSFGICGSLVLAWFGWMALHQKSEMQKNNLSRKNKSVSCWKHWRDGYLLTLINPYTVLFWSSVSVTLASNMQTSNAIVYAGIGVLLGVFSWVFALNGLLHFTRHRISHHTMQKINFVGGVILMSFAVIGLWRAIML